LGGGGWVPPLFGGVFGTWGVEPLGWVIRFFCHVGFFGETSPFLLVGGGEGFLGGLFFPPQVCLLFTLLVGTRGGVPPFIFFFFFPHTFFFSLLVCVCFVFLFWFLFFFCLSPVFPPTLFFFFFFFFFFFPPPPPFPFSMRTVRPPRDHLFHPAFLPADPTAFFFYLLKTSHSPKRHALFRNKLMESGACLLMFSPVFYQRPLRASVHAAPLIPPLVNLSPGCSLLDPCSFPSSVQAACRSSPPRCADGVLPRVYGFLLFFS